MGADFYGLESRAGHPANIGACRVKTLKPNCPSLELRPKLSLIKIINEKSSRRLLHHEKVICRLFQSIRLASYRYFSLAGATIRALIMGSPICRPIACLLDALPLTWRFGQRNYQAQILDKRTSVLSRDTRQINSLVILLNIFLFSLNLALQSLINAKRLAGLRIEA